MTQSTPPFSLSRWLLKTLMKLVFLMVALSAFQVWIFKYLNPPGTVNMAYEYLAHQLWDAPRVPPVFEWRDLDAISPHLRRAVLASEDQRFMTHRGFDFEEIKVVVTGMFQNQGFRGASTISMQAARSLFLPASRSPIRKLAEAWYTLLMETLWDKPRILEVYLNCVDWGTGLVGAQAASQKYFKTDADRITAAQAALLAAVLPSPHKWSPVRPTPYLNKRKEFILGQMPAMPLLP